MSCSIDEWHSCRDEENINSEEYVWKLVRRNLQLDTRCPRINHSIVVQTEEDQEYRIQVQVAAEGEGIEQLQIEVIVHLGGGKFCDRKYKRHEGLLQRINLNPVLRSKQD